MRDAWFYPLCATTLLVGGFFAINAAYTRGYEAGAAKVEESRQFVIERMEATGFCGWVEANDFIQHCQRRRSALEAIGEKEEWLRRS